MSICVEYSVDPRRTSGGRYHKVTTSFEYVLVGTDFARASPKSASCAEREKQFELHSTQSAINEMCPYFKFAALVDEQVLGLEVSVEDAALVAVVEAPQQLEEEEAHVVRAEHVAALVHVLLQVAVQVLEHQRQRLFRVHDVVQSN